jgi:hypothetical protein
MATRQGGGRKTGENSPSGERLTWKEEGRVADVIVDGEKKGRPRGPRGEVNG